MIADETDVEDFKSLNDIEKLFPAGTQPRRYIFKSTEDKPAWDQITQFLLTAGTDR